MKKVDIKKLAGVGTLSVGLVLGLSGFAGALDGTIDTTGPDSTNEIKYDADVDFDHDNNNTLDLTNETNQDAASGDAKAKHSTTAGDAETGEAMNENSVSADIVVENSSSTAWSGGGLVGAHDVTATIENTGPNSDNTVDYDYDLDVDTENNNNVNISNQTNQTATSGDAEVSNNTTGGNAVSGSASNTSSSTFSIHISN